MDFKNFNTAGNFPGFFKITGEQLTGPFAKTLEYDNVYDHDEPTYKMSFDYCFQFNYKYKITGLAFVYRGGFYIEYSKPYGCIYKSSHCNHFSMPMCQHFNNEGQFTQYFIDRIGDVLESDYDYLIKDEFATALRYRNQRK